MLRAQCPSYFGSPAWGNQECPSCFGYHIRPIEGQGKKGKGRERKGLAGLAGLWGAQPPRNGVQCLRFEGVRREAMNAEISSPSFHPHPILGCSCMHVFFFLTSRMHRSDGSINFKEFPTSQTSTTSEKSETSQTSKTLQTSKNSNVPRKVCGGARRNGVQYFNLGQLQLAQPELFSPNQNSKGYPSINLIRKRASEEESFSIRRFLDRVPLLAVKL